jgi:hypothetical protein
VAKVSFGGKEAAKVNKIVKRKLEAVEMGRRGGYSFYKGKILRQERRRGCPNCHKMSISRVKSGLQDVDKLPSLATERTGDWVGCSWGGEE